MTEHAIMRVEVTPLAMGRVQVDVDAGQDRTAKVTAPCAQDALAFASAFMVAVVEPDPMEMMFRLPSAPDGPRDQGGDV